MAVKPVLYALSLLTLLALCLLELVVIASWLPLRAMLGMVRRG